MPLYRYEVLKLETARQGDNERKVTEMHPKADEVLHRAERQRERGWGR